MDIYRSLDQLPVVPSSTVTIGTFDGLHRGHQEIVKKVVSISHSKNEKAVLVTFDPHPRHILDSEVKLPILIHIDKKLELLKNLGLDIVLVIPFNKEFSRITAKQFLETIVCNQFNPSSIIVGYDHHFGFKREGSPSFLKSFGKNRNISIEIVEPICDEDVIISSTHIRKLLHDGYIRRASFELGWVFGFCAKVVHGAGRGKSLSFPTANFLPLEKNQLIPANGVYLTRGRINSKNLYGMCNLGVRPTFGESEFVMEVHFFNNNLDDLYGKNITVEFLERIRDEIKFSNPEELIKQLHQDYESCQNRLKKYH